ncbi:MAG: hypothetical protein R3C20_12340 [Planctomycetaceae bacterium]
MFRTSTLFSCILVASYWLRASHLFAGDDHHSQTAWPVAVAGVDMLHPEAILQALEEFSSLTETKPNFWWDLQKTVVRRFDRQKHIPYQKGFAVFFGEKGLFRLDFEYVLDATGAAAAVEEFSRQWTAPDVPRPNYELEIDHSDDQSWSVMVNSLSWNPVFPREPDGPIRYEKTSRPHYRTFFRLHDGFLWSSSRKEQLWEAPLHDVPAAVLQPSGGEKRRLAFIWLSPDGIPLNKRRALIDQLTKTAAPALQRYDSETNTASKSRILQSLIRMELFRSLLLDVESGLVELCASEEGLSTHGLITFEASSRSETWLQAIQPRHSPRRFKADDTGLTLHVSGSIPGIQIDENGLGLSAIDSNEGFDVLTKILITGERAEHVSAFASLKSSEWLVGSVRQLVSFGESRVQGQAESHFLSALSVTEADDHRSISFNYGDFPVDAASISDSPSVQAAGLQLEINGTFLRQLRRILYQQANTSPQPGVDEIQSVGDHGISVQVTAKGREVHLNGSADTRSTYELLACLAKLIPSPQPLRVQQ